MPHRFADAASGSRPLHLVDKVGLASWRESLPPEAANWVSETGFAANAGELCLLPDPAGRCIGAAFGLGEADKGSRTRFAVSEASAKLPKGAWHLAGSLTRSSADEAALGWLLAAYRFSRYKAVTGPAAQLVAPDGIDARRIEAIAAGECLTRDLINTPASDMGPEHLEDAARALADEFGATFSSIVGDDLLKSNFPMIHAVGRASARAPRLIDLRWGTEGPTLSLVGKGVCFDTGGLNIKPGASMGLMKKDMGGAATVLGLARIIMALKLPIRLRVLIPAVENSIDGSAFRPQDILTSRKGLTVEINNTDAEGRLVLADALAFADEDNPDLLISMATLTGAARVAVGPDIAPYFTDDTVIAKSLADAGETVRDPVWQLPLHEPYETMIEPAVADLDNAPSGGFAGSVTAALFLRRFVSTSRRYVHFDIYGWQPTAAPARPKGGVGQGARAILEALPVILELPRP